LYLAAGALGGVTILYKQVAGATFAALCADRAFEGLRARRFVHAVRDLLLLGMGLAVVGAAMVLHLRAIGVWPDAKFWTWTYVFRHYIPAGTRGEGFAYNLLTSFVPFMLTVSPLWLLGWRARRSELSPVWWWWLGSMSAGLVGGRMYGHYFLLMVPALSVLGGVGAVSWLLEHEPRRQLLMRVLAVVAGGFFVFASLLEATTGSFVTRKPDYVQASAYVRERTRPDERIFVWGWFPALYVAADRCPASRFVYTHILSGSEPGGGSGHNVPEGWSMLMSDLERERPAYILDTSKGSYSYDFPIDRFSQLSQFVKAHYVFDTELGGIQIFRRIDR
jgi:hypothetical protein